MPPLRRWDDSRAAPWGASLAEVQRAMNATGRCRAAVTSDDGRLLGLLCLRSAGLDSALTRTSAPVPKPALLSWAASVAASRK